MKATLVISFFNKIRFLELVFAGLERQSFREFEIIIADDGSTDESVKYIETLSRKVSFPLLHIWQEDKGFRKNKILNKAVSSSSAELVIFIDGDCIPHKDFIKEHVNNSKINHCFTGRRVNLSQKISEKLNSKNVSEGILEKKLPLIIDGLFGKSVDVEKGLYFKNPYLRNIFNKKKRGLLGSNFSLFKSDMLKINGFDERYTAPSIGEDSDVQYRLELTGVTIGSLNNMAIQYHLYHKLLERPRKNLDLFEEVKKSSRSYTPFGIKKQ